MSETLSGLFNRELTDIYIIGRAEASDSPGCSMINLAVYMVESVHTYVYNMHAHVRMSVFKFDRNVS